MMFTTALKNFFIRSQMKVIGRLCILAVLSACSNGSSSSDDEKTSEILSEKVLNVPRPAESSPEAIKLAFAHDHQVALLMRNVREMKDAIEQGAKVTPEIESSLKDFLSAAEEADNALTPTIKAQLNEKHYEMVERNSERLKERKIEMQTLIQTK